MTAHELARQLLLGPDIEIRFPAVEDHYSDTEPIVSVSLVSMSIDPCENCLPACQSTGRYSHAGLDHLGPCMRPECNPMCKGYSPKRAEVLVLG